MYLTKPNIFHSEPDLFHFIPPEKQVCFRGVRCRFAFRTFSIHVLIKLKRSEVPFWHRRGMEGLRGLNKGLKCPLTVKYIPMTLCGMSKSSEN